MGNVIPDRFFWALPPDEEADEGEDSRPSDAEAASATKSPRHVH